MDAHGDYIQVGDEENADPERFLKAAAVEVRLGFVRKVYGMLALQILILLLVVGFMHTMTKSTIQILRSEHTIFAGINLRWNGYNVSVPPTEMSVDSIFVPILCFTDIVLFIALVAAKFQTVRTNCIVFVIFTFVEATLLGMCAWRHTAMSAIATFMLAVVIFAGLTATACSAKTVFSHRSLVRVACCCMAVFGIGLWIAAACGLKWATLDVFSNFGFVVFFMCYIVWDTQNVLGSGLTGASRRDLNFSDEHFEKAVALYIDLVGLIPYLGFIVLKLVSDKGQ